jgi:hypothetical protein
MLSECVRNILLQVLKFFSQLSSTLTLLFNLKSLHILPKLCQSGTIHQLFKHFETIFDLSLRLSHLFLSVLEIQGGAAGFIIAASSELESWRGFSESALKVVVCSCGVDHNFT